MFLYYLFQPGKESNRILPTDHVDASIIIAEEKCTNRSRVLTAGFLQAYGTMTQSLTTEYQLTAWHLMINDMEMLPVLNANCMQTENQELSTNPQLSHDSIKSLWLPRPLCSGIRKFTLWLYSDQKKTSFILWTTNQWSDNFLTHLTKLLSSPAALVTQPGDFSVAKLKQPGSS